MMRGVGGVRKSIHQKWLAKGLGLGLLCWGFKRVQEEIPREEASTLQIGSVAFPPGQCTSPQLHLCTQTIWARWVSRQFLTLPCSLWLLVIPKAQRLSLWDNWGDERGCDKGHWYAHTRTAMEPSSCWDSSGGDYSIHCWWDLIRLKQLSSVPVYRA